MIESIDNIDDFQWFIFWLSVMGIPQVISSSNVTITLSE